MAPDHFATNPSQPRSRSARLHIGLQ